MRPVVYILKSIRTNRYYIGSTGDLNKRLDQHIRGHTATTKRLTPFSLVFKQSYTSLKIARQVERKLKSWKRKDFIDKIVNEGRITFSKS